MLSTSDWSDWTKTHPTKAKLSTKWKQAVRKMESLSTRLHSLSPRQLCLHINTENNLLWFHCKTVIWPVKTNMTMVSQSGLSVIWWILLSNNLEFLGWLSNPMVITASDSSFMGNQKCMVVSYGLSCFIYKDGRYCDSNCTADLQTSTRNRCTEPSGLKACCSCPCLKLYTSWKQLGSPLAIHCLLVTLEHCLILDLMAQATLRHNKWSKNDVVMMYANKNQDHSALNIIRPCAFSALLCIIKSEILCYWHVQKVLHIMFLVLGLVLVTGNNFRTLTQECSVLFWGWPISWKQDVKKIKCLQILLFVTLLTYVQYKQHKSTSKIIWALMG